MEEDQFTKLKANVKKIDGAESSPKVSEGSKFITTDEKAQYEVFRNGSLPRETIEGWIRNDLKAIMSFVHGCLNEKDVFASLVDAFYSRYQKLHETKEENERNVN